MARHSRTFPFWPVLGALASLSGLGLSLLHGYVMQDSYGGAMTPREPRSARVTWQEDRLYVDGQEIRDAASLRDKGPTEQDAEREQDFASGRQSTR